MAFITIAGEQLIAQKQGASEVLNITHFVLANISGLGAEPGNRIESLPDTGDIVDTKAVTKQGYVNSNQVVYSLSLDSTIGDYTFNWVGLKSAEGVLIACAHIAPQIKTANDGATPGNNLTRNFLLAFSGIQATTAIAVPAETWQIDFTTRLLQIDERERLSNFDTYGPGLFFGDAFKVEFVSGTTYKIKTGIAYVGGIRCLALTDALITAATPPKDVYIDASLQGDINGVSAVIAFTASSSSVSDYTDSLGFHHYVFKIANIPSAGVVIDLRPAPYENMKPGSVIFSAANVVQTGFLKCNGAAVSRSTFSALFAVIGTLYGAGNNSTTFNLPDLRGQFIRGWDDGRGLDPSRVFGSSQDSNNKSHRHRSPTLDENPSGTPGFYMGTAEKLSYNYDDPGGAQWTDYEGGLESRPRNVALLPLIKY